MLTYNKAQARTSLLASFMATDMTLMAYAY